MRKLGNATRAARALLYLSLAERLLDRAGFLAVKLDSQEAMALVPVWREITDLPPWWLSGRKAES